MSNEEKDLGMKPFNECTPAEIDAYNTAQQDSVDCITRSIGKLRIRNLHAGVSQDEIAENNEKISDLKVDRALLRARRVAYFANRARIEPPTETQLSALKTNLDEVNRLTVERRIVVEVVKLTTDALNTFTEIQPEQA